MPTLHLRLLGVWALAWYSTPPSPIPENRIWFRGPPSYWGFSSLCQKGPSPCPLHRGTRFFCHLRCCLSGLGDPQGATASVSSTAARAAASAALLLLRRWQCPLGYPSCYFTRTLWFSKRSTLLYIRQHIHHALYQNIFYLYPTAYTYKHWYLPIIPILCISLRKAR